MTCNASLHEISVGEPALSAGGYFKLAGMLDRTKPESNILGFLFHRLGALFCPWLSEPRPSGHHCSGLTPTVHWLLHLCWATMPSFQDFHLADGLIGTSKPSFSHELIPQADSFPVVYVCVHSTGSAFLGTLNMALITPVPSGTSLLAASLSFSFFFPKVREITPIFHRCCESTKKLTEFCCQLLDRTECLCLYAFFWS